MRDIFANGEWEEFILLHEREVDDNPVKWLDMFRLMYYWSDGYWSVKLLNRAMERMMARGTGKETSAVKKGVGQWTTFVEIPVEASDAPKMRKLYEDGASLTNDLQALLEQGYRVSFSHNPQNDALICSVTCKAEGDPNEGCTYTSFAGSWYDALMVALYKHYHVAKKVWKRGEGGSNRPAFG